LVTIWVGWQSWVGWRTKKNPFLLGKKRLPILAGELLGHQFGSPAVKPR
jgi:hypothetical protein